MSSTLGGVSSTLVAIASTLVAIASTLVAIASTLVAIASTLVAIASTLVAIASTLGGWPPPMQCNLRSRPPGRHPSAPCLRRLPGTPPDGVRLEHSDCGGGVRGGDFPVAAGTGGVAIRGRDRRDDPGRWRRRMDRCNVDLMSNPPIGIGNSDGRFISRESTLQDFVNSQAIGYRFCLCFVAGARDD